MKWVRLFLLIFIFILSFIVPSAGFAHSSGASFEKEVNGYLIDIGYDPAQFTALSPSSFDFDLIDTKSSERVAFTDVWVRINQGNQALLATGVHKQNLGGATLLHTFAEGGSYELIVRYQNDGEEVVSATFPLEVLPSDEGADSSSTGPTGILLGVIAILIAGNLTTALLFFKNRKK